MESAPGQQQKERRNAVEGEGIMGLSQFGLTGRVLCGFVAAALLAGVSIDASADYKDQPKIRLQLGEGSVDPDLLGGGVNRFIFEEPGNPKPVEEQTFTFDRGPLKCTVSGYKDLAGVSHSLAAPPLVSLAASPSGKVGMGPDSMGVYNGATGVSCYRITADVDGTTDESLTINVNGAGNSETGPMSGYAFNRLELDMEVKSNAKFSLTVFTGTTEGRTYELYSGRSIEGESGLTTGEQSPDTQKFQCGAGSADSNQDSGPNDNCRWIINDFGTRFTLTADAGEGSLEGGGDWGGDYGGLEAAFANNTIIYLVKLSETGTLTCDDTCDESIPGDCSLGGDDHTGVIGDGQSFARCSVTRLANVGTAGIQGGVCAKTFDYTLSTELSEDACNLDQNPAPNFTAQFAASVKVQFPPEDRLDIAQPSVHYTEVQFSKPEGGLTDAWRPDRCEGTVVLDANGNKTIAEVLGPDDHYDPATDGVGIGVVDKTTSDPLDWACILETTIEYVGSDQMQRTDTVLFWGDARFSTQ